MSGQHAILAPSSAFRWVVCHGSLAMEANAAQSGLVELDGPEAMEGDAAHHVAAYLLRTGELLAVGDVAPNGVVIDHDMLDGAMLYAEHVADRRPGAAVLHVEERVLCPSIHEACWGTPDAWLYAGNVLDVWDYKYGHLFIDAFENWQLLTYTAGILESLGIDGLADQSLRVRLHLVQPRNYGHDRIKTWEVKACDLRPYFNILAAAAAEALKPLAPTRVDPKACRDCLARHTCDALQRTAYDAAHTAGTSVPFNLPAGALGRELQVLKRAQQALEARISGLESQAVSMIRAGQNVAFWQLSETKPRMRWTRPAEDVIALGQLFDVDLAKPLEPITPPQAVKLGIDESVISDYADRPRGELKLVPADTTLARKVFGTP
jgi:hypothetical protein